jgi:dihydroneopterin triphosphate diphosphatase
MRTTQIECIVFRKKESAFEFLLLKRIPKKGGFWQPPCGGLEKDDFSKLEAAYRELLEEANIKKEDVIRVIENVDVFEINKHYLTGKPIPAITEYVFGFEVNSDLSVSIHNNIYPEHETFEWVSFDKALSLLKWENNKVALQKLNQLLDKEKLF